MPSTQRCQYPIPYPASLILTLLFGLLLTVMPAHCALASDQPSIKNDIETIDFTHSEQVSGFIDYMVSRHGFKQNELTQFFNQVQFNSKSIQFIKPAPLSKPKNWAAYRARFIEPVRIKAGVNFWNNYQETLLHAEQQFGVPAQIIVGIIGIETTFGRDTGKFRTADALATLGFAYPDTPNKETRMAYFRSELEQVLLLARESGLDPLSFQGSYAGAIGWPQFMPSSIRRFGIDFDGDGKINLRESPQDAIGSVANFLVQHGWQTRVPLVFPATIVNDHPEEMLAKELNATFTLAQLAEVAIPTQKNAPTQFLYGLIDLQNGKDPTEYWLATQNFFAITQYNRSYFYAMAVIELGKAICMARNPDDSCQLCCS